MKLIIRYMKLSGLILISLFLFVKVPAQNFRETLKFAENQFNSGDLSTSLKTYQRALFFSEGEDNLYIFRQLAMISYIKEDFEGAQEYYGLAYNQAENDSLRDELLFLKATCQIINRQYQFAIIDLLSVNDSALSVKRRLNFYLGVCYFGLEDFTNAKSCFKYCVNDHDKQELEKLFSGRKLSSPSPNAARILSMIIPGSGQVYSGDMKAGVNSLLLTSGLIALGINISVKYQLIDAIATVLPWYQRYYMGGIGKAEEIAVSRRQARRNETYVAVLKLVEGSMKK